MPDRAVIRISTSGVARTSRRLSRAEQGMQLRIEEAIHELRQPIERIFEIRSPSSGIAGGLFAQPVRTPGRVGFELVSTYRDKFTGYDPLGVTRFGHRKKVIRPRADRAPSSVIATSAPRGPTPQFKGEKGQTALRFPGPAGGAIFRHYAAGQTRRTDWVEDANVEARAVISREADRLGRKVVSSFR